mmetsp:Transcript_10653/g.20646  ORF Transcript_10653/g.20646 Transcript_10653/m.20646 type:complete len:119 (+) Transcript_10653:1102-1458(+)
MPSSPHALAGALEGRKKVRAPAQNQAVEGNKTIHKDTEKMKRLIHSKVQSDSVSFCSPHTFLSLPGIVWKEERIGKTSADSEAKKEGKGRKRCASLKGRKEERAAPPTPSMHEATVTA